MHIYCAPLVTLRSYFDHLGTNAVASLVPYGYQSYSPELSACACWCHVCHLSLGLFESVRVVSAGRAHALSGAIKLHPGSR